MADNAMYAKDTFKAYPGDRNVKKYINCGKYYASRGLKWIPTGNRYSDATSLVKIFCYGFANLTEIGKVHTTWYVRFRGTN